MSTPHSHLPSPRPSLPARLLVAACLAGLVASCKNTSDEQGDAGSAAVSQRVTAEATVQAVDQEKRLVTLLREDGVPFTVLASDVVRNLPQVEVGDVVKVVYEESLIARIQKPGEPVAVPAGTLGLAVAEEGEKPGGAVGGSLSTTVRIESIDLERNIVVFTPLEGGLRAVPVVRPEFQDYIKKLKPGDLVQLTFREALAISFVETADADGE